MSKQNYYYVDDCGPNYFIECIIAYWLWRTIPFILLFIGTCGNILNIIILSRKQLRKYSTAVFILILAITELVVLWTSLLPDTLLGIKGRRIEDEFPVICHLKYWISMTAGTYSTWILVLLTIERILLTKAPVFSRRKITPRNCLIVLLIVLFLIASANSHLIYGSRFYHLQQNENSTISVTGNVTDGFLPEHNRTERPFQCYFVSAQYETFYRHYWSVFFLIVYNVIPAIIIVCGNINLIAVILFRRRGLFSRVHPVVHPAGDMRRRASAKLLLALSVFYLLTTTPWCVYWLLRGMLGEHDIGDEIFAKWQLATVIVNILLWCNFSFNFFFYFTSGTLFKREWNRLFDKVKSSFQRQG